MDRQSKNTIAVFWTYDDILLRHFIEVLKSGDYRLLIKSGEPTADECLEAWEKIVQKNNYQSGNNAYNNYLNLIKQYNLAMKELTAVVSTIKCLEFVIDQEQIGYLRRMGYKIDTTCGSGFARSLEIALHESGRIKTKIKIKANQINNYNARTMEQKESQEEQSADDLISSLSMEVGFQLPETVTLSQYNAYAKRVKKRNEALEKANKKRGNVRA